MKIIKLAMLLASVFLLASCAETTRLGMTRDNQTGIQIGSAIEHSFFTDAGQFKNRQIKVTTRNVSGEAAYRLRGLEGLLEQAFREKGFTPVKDEGFGIKLDVNVIYSGHAQQNMAQQFGFLGGAAGGITGYRSDTRASTATGLLAGATIGAIIGSYITDDTYIVIAEVSIGVSDSPDSSSDKKVIRFDSSPQLQEEKSSGNFKAFRQINKTRVAVYAGGRNMSQDQVAEQVKLRLIDIVRDVI